MRRLLPLLSCLLALVCLGSAAGCNLSTAMAGPRNDIQLAYQVEAATRLQQIRRDTQPDLPDDLQKSPQAAGQAARQPVKQMYFFTAKWCGVCRQFVQAQDFPYLRRSGWTIGPEATNHIRIVDIEEQPDLAQKFQVGQGIPLYVMTVDGKETARYVGRVLPDQLANLFNATQAPVAQSVPSGRRRQLPRPHPGLRIPATADLSVASTWQPLPAAALSLSPPGLKIGSTQEIKVNPQFGLLLSSGCVIAHDGKQITFSQPQPALTMHILGNHTLDRLTSIEYQSDAVVLHLQRFGALHLHLRAP